MNESEDQKSIADYLRELDGQARRANVLLRNLNDKLFWIAVAIWMGVLVLWCCFFSLGKLLS